MTDEIDNWTDALALELERDYDVTAYAIGPTKYLDAYVEMEVGRGKTVEVDYDKTYGYVVTVSEYDATGGLEKAYESYDSKSWDGLADKVYSLYTQYRD